MGLNKNYQGYQSYEYLEADYDYKSFEMADQLNRVEGYKVPITEKEEELTEEIMRDTVIISMHEHPVRFPADIKEVFEYTRQGREFTAYKGLAHSPLDGVFDNLMDGTCAITSKHGWKWRDVIYDLGMRLSDIAHQNFVIKCEDVDDIFGAYENGQLALVPTMEGAAMIENELDRIDILYGLGVRSIGITYSEANTLGSGLKEKRDGGLTSFGRQAVERMNKIGIAIDISHSGDRTSKDVIEASDKPVFISHAGARSLWDSPRLKSDEVLKACAKNDGVIGIEAAPHTTLTKNNTKHGIESFMEHFEYIKELVGIDHVSFGPDTLYGDHVGLHHAYAEHLSIKDSQSQDKDFNEVDYVKGLENPTEASINIIRWLVKNDYSKQDIQKVIGGNTIRALREIWY
ncbi:MAG TPA: membrane dipeptidase [Halanaerobiales bacterium]|nr:membrane dipeptidase [Halanaerobiales bacterium]